MKQHELIYNLDSIDDIVDDVVMLMATYSILTLSGTLGAGKTTLVQAILKYHGIYEEIQSPTFTYLNTYTNAQGQTFYHFDLYRMGSLHEFIDAGFLENFSIPDSWSFIEWPEIIMPILKKNVCHIAVDYHGFDRRRLRYMLPS